MDLIDRVVEAGIELFDRASAVGGRVYYPPGVWFCRLTGMSNLRAAKELYIVSTAIGVYADRGSWVYVAIGVVTLPFWLIAMDHAAADVERTHAGAATIKRSSHVFHTVSQFIVIAAMIHAAVVLLVLLAARQWTGTLDHVSEQLTAVAVTLVFNPRPPARSLVRDLVDRMAIRRSTRLRAA